MITADQLVAHLVGDYILQSDWMANKKRTDSVAAFAHATVYSLPFLLFAGSGWAYAVILLTHFLIDRFGLARYVVWAKNLLAPRWMSVLVSGSWAGDCGCHPVCTTKSHGLGTSTAVFALRRTLPWRSCQKTGYPPDRPDWLAVWLLIIADNVLHILINGAALAWL